MAPAFNCTQQYFLFSSIVIMLLLRHQVFGELDGVQQRIRKNQKYSSDSNSDKGYTTNTDATTKYGYTANDVLSVTTTTGQYDGTGGINSFVIQTSWCIPFSSPKLQSALSNGKSEYSCLTNKCKNGCCRLINDYLQCDTDNTFPQYPCVCKLSPTDEDEDRVDDGQVDVVQVDDGSNGTQRYTGPNYVDRIPLPTVAVCDAVWQQYKGDNVACTSTGACLNVSVDRASTNETVCCLQRFCWCGKYTNYNDCL